MLKTLSIDNPSVAKAYKEFGRFAVVGVINTAVDIGIYTFLTRLIPLFFGHLLFAKAVSFVVATVCSFTLNRQWTFQQQGKVRIHEILRFYSTVGSAIFINLGVVYIFHTKLHFHDLFAVVIATGFTVVWNFLFTKFWVFTNKR
jgi:putative flippase GtrA